MHVSTVTKLTKEGQISTMQLSFIIAIFLLRKSLKTQIHDHPHSYYLQMLPYLAPQPPL